jgi:flagellar FliL protein
MADDELDLDVAKKAGKGKLIMIIGGALLLVGIAVAATLFFTGALGGGDSKDDEAEDAKPKIEAKKAIYMKLSPAFVVNFEDSSTVSYMQLEIQAMAREQDALDLISEHMPVIRNNILLLLSTQKYEEISTAAGKEKLRGEILASIQKVLDEETAAAKSEEEKDSAESKKSAKVAAVYFTSFIMQ